MGTSGVLRTPGVQINADIVPSRKVEVMAPAAEVPHPRMKPTADRSIEGGTTMSVRYLFAGRERYNDVEPYITQWAQEYEDIEVKFEEIDILRGGDAHDLSRIDLQKLYLNTATVVDVTLTTPPCSTFSRVLYANGRGPPPGRSRTFPKGFPWLSGWQKRKVEQANMFVDFSIDVLRHVAIAGKLGLLEHPEDLGLAGEMLDANK